MPAFAKPVRGLPSSASHETKGRFGNARPVALDEVARRLVDGLVSSGETILRDVGNVALIVNPGVIEVLVGSGCIEIDASGSAPLSDSVITELAKKAVSRVR
ncbi:MAG TPA: hypothetical protein VIM30_08065 [Candidatus Limnocylindrales bacterium]|jgi:hypothetical protein